jgi:hypothetical protein
MRKVIAIFLLCVYILFVYQSTAYSFVSTTKVTTGLAKVAGQMASVTVSDVVTSASASRAVAKAIAAGVVRVAIPLGWVVGIGFLVYDLSKLIEKVRTSPVLAPAPGTESYTCSGTVKIVNQGRWDYRMYDYWASLCDRTFTYIGNADVIKIYNFPQQETYCSWCFKSRTDANYFYAYYVYSQNANGTWRYWGPVYGHSVEVAVCPSGQPNVTTPTEQDIKDWIETHPNEFRDIIQNQTPSEIRQTKPSDAVELSRDEYSIPDSNITVSTKPQDQQDQESQQNPTEQPMPTPNSDTDYINPGTPDAPQFDSSIQPPEKKNIGDLLDRFISSIPFVGALRSTSISASGQCSFSVPTPFGTTGTLDFCRFESVFRVIGGFIFTFASLYAIWIIFKRSD